jgi:hypothetical protein
LCISARSAGQEIDVGHAKTSVAKLSTAHINFRVFTDELLLKFIP